MNDLIFYKGEYGCCYVDVRDAASGMYGGCVEQDKNNDKCIDYRSHITSHISRELFPADID
jgi:hypothetical protein